MPSRVRVSLHQICGFLVIALGLVVLLGWVMGHPALTTLLPGNTYPTKLSTAFSFILIGWALIATRTRSPWQRQLQKSCLVLVGLIAGFTLQHYITGWDPDIEQLLIHDRLSSPEAIMHMSDQSAVLFMLLTIAIGTARSQREARIVWSQSLTLIASWLTLLGLFGYLFSIADFYLFIDRQTVISPQTLLGFACLSVGVLSLHPRQGLLEVISSRSLGGRISRTLLPWFFIVPLLLRVLKVWSQRQWQLRPSTGDGLVALMTSSLLIGLLWFTARSLNQQEEKLLSALQSTQEVERRFRQIVMQAPQPMALHRSDGRVLEVNDAWVSLSGYSLAETPTIDQWIEKAYGTEAASIVLPVIQSMYELSMGQQVADGEFVIRTKSGALRTWDFYSSALGPDAEGRSLVLSTAIDVTDRAIADRQLRDLSENLEHLVQIRTTELEAIRDQLENAQRVAKVGSWAFELATQTIQWSPQLFRLFGMDPSEPEPSFEAHQQQIHPLDRDHWLRHVQACVQQGQDYDIDFRIIWPDGSIHWLNGQGEAVRNAEGQVIRLVGTAIDITDRKETELRLAQAEEQARLLVENNPGVVYRFSPDHQQDVGYVSPQIETLLGVERSQWKAGFANTWQQFVHPAELEWVLQQFAAAIAEQRAYSLEYRMLRTDGRVIWVRDQGEILSQPDGTVLIQGLAIDITALKETGLALQQRLQELNQRNQEMLLLGQLNEFLQACSTVNEAGQVVAGFMPKLFPDSQGQLSLIHGTSNLQAVVQWGQPTHTQHSFLASDCWALRRGSSYFYRPSLVPSPACQHLAGLIGPEENILCLPLTAFGDIIGHLQFELPQVVDDESQINQPLAETIAEQLALAIANLQLRETLRQESLRDPLTGLFNRRYLHEFFEQELARASRGHDNIGVLMVDIDHFKRFNDRFGHDAGDLVLKQVAQALVRNVRSSDVVCRYGGEELAIVMPGANLDFAARKAEVIRQVVAELVVDYRGQSLPPLTISIGVTSFPDSGTTSDALLQAADTSLYQAKAAGRNCVVVSQPNWSKLEAGAIEETSPIAPTPD